MQKKKQIGASEADDPSGGGKTIGKDIPPQNKTVPSNKKEAPPAGLPTIGLNSGIYINELSLLTAKLTIWKGLSKA